ncbi:MAG: DNA mismatch repair endonuclease MutL [Verrucomicrobiota bacterium JB022]|nr:DNA mismatch repair endonuclease MutL [Verrucomicrobiota bacterium JB022]
MPRIVQLPDHVANQIAAGEVVERPVAVVKELVENSLDAGATRIEIEFRQGGKRLIRVTDNGCGMDPEDVVNCLERHATSKIRSADDLSRIASFGFRGEALPSIASVSDFLLRSRPAEAELGTEVKVTRGRRSAPSGCGMSQGTHIEVARLFNAVPARRKFLKTDRTEAAHITHLCRLLAVAHPEVAFTLIEDGREVFRSPECATLRERVQEIYGARLGQELVELELAEETHNGGNYRVWGLLGEPGVGRATRADMLAYVNRRPVDSRLVQYGLVEAYHSYLPSGRYPVAYLFLDVPPATVDVNVHPAKREVRFREEGFLRRFIMEAVLETLRKAARHTLKRAERVEDFAPEPEPIEDEAEEEVEADDVPAAQPLPPAEEPTSPPAKATETPPAAPPEPPKPALRPAPIAKAAPRPPIRVAPLPKKETAAPQPAPPRASPPVARPLAAKPTAAPAPQLSWKVLGIVQDRLAWLESREGVVCLNLRAAQERVTFERIEAQGAQAEQSSQTLLFPLSLELSPLEVDTVERHPGFWEELGFTLEPFGKNFYRVSSIPGWFEPEAAVDYLHDLIGLVREQGARSFRAEDARASAHRLAVKRLVRLSPLPTEAEVLPLAEALLRCRQPLTNPEGQPTFFELRKGEIDQRLGL